MSNSSRGREFFTGAKDQVPLLLAVIPFGMVFGGLALAAGIPPLATQGLSLFVFAGSAQFIAVGMIAEGAPPLAVGLTILAVNLRHLLYSASMAPYLEGLSRRWKGLLAWLLTDEAYAVASLRYRRNERSEAHWYFLGTGLALWASWQLSTAVGMVMGSRIPASWNLDFALPLIFLALLVPTLGELPVAIAAACAALSSLMLSGLPYKLNLLLGGIVGVAAGLLADRYRRRVTQTGESGS